MSTFIIILGILETIFGIVQIFLNPMYWYYGVANIVFGIIILYLTYGTITAELTMKKSKILEYRIEELQKELEKLQLKDRLNGK